MKNLGHLSRIVEFYGDAGLTITWTTSAPAMAP